MKLYRLLTAILAAVLFMPVFTSCDKDDDPSVADPIIGTYSGSLGYFVSGYDPGNIDGEYELKILKDNSDHDDIVMILPECSFTPPIGQGILLTIPSLTVHDVDVTGNEDKYIISEDDFEIDLNGSKYTGKIYGTVTGKNADIKYTIRPGRMPMDIVFTFTGTLK